MEWGTRTAVIKLDMEERILVGDIVDVMKRHRYTIDGAIKGHDIVLVEAENDIAEIILQNDMHFYVISGADVVEDEDLAYVTHWCRVDQEGCCGTSPRNCGTCSDASWKRLEQ